MLYSILPVGSINLSIFNQVFLKLFVIQGFLFHKLALRCRFPQFSCPHGKIIFDCSRSKQSWLWSTLVSMQPVHATVVLPESLQGFSFWSITYLWSSPWGERTQCTIATTWSWKSSFVPASGAERITWEVKVGELFPIFNKFKKLVNFFRFLTNFKSWWTFSDF